MTQHIEDARTIMNKLHSVVSDADKLEVVAAWVSIEAIFSAALAAAEERGRIEERERCAKLYGSVKLFGHWSKHRLSDGVFLPLVCYVPEGHDYTTVPLYAITKEPTP